MTLKTVVLPEPFGPMRPTISPALHGEIELVDGTQSAEGHRQAGRLQQRH